MAFGKRSLEAIPADLRRSRAPSARPIEPQIDQWATIGALLNWAANIWTARPKWQRQLSTFTCTIVAICIASFGILPALQGSSNVPQVRVAFPTSESEDRITFHLPVSGVSAAVAQHNTALRKACLQFDGETRSDTRREAFVDAQWSEIDQANGKLVRWFSHSTDFLTCLLEREADRYCVPGERQKVVDLLTEYISIARRRVNRARGALGTAMGQTLANVDGRIKSARNNGKQTSAGPTIALDGRLVRAVERLSDDGRLTAHDFKNEVPPELTPYILKGQAETCK
jgi:hypothetical protein